MIPVIPHFSNECLKLIKLKKILNGQIMMKNFRRRKNKYCYSNKWKKRGLLKTKKNIDEKMNLFEIINKDEN